jgi:signal transduction histidine kinase/AraC-like DNA-binding protein/ABC-type sugar transport system substrate-binding protein
MNINRLKNPVHKARVGLQIAPYDPFWVLVREAIETRVQKYGLDLVLVETPENPTIWTLKEETQFLEDILALDLDVLISWNLSAELIRNGIAHNLPIVFLSELHDETIDHPKFTSPQGFYSIGESLGHFLAEQLKYRGHFLCLGEPGQRITGFIDAISTYPDITLTCCPCSWHRDQAYEQIKSIFAEFHVLPNAIFGQSDPIALAACDVVAEMHLSDYAPLVVGTNGDPEALAAILNNRMLATIDINADALGEEVISFALNAIQGQALPLFYNYQWQMVTAANLAEISVQKLAAIAKLPSRMVGINRQSEQNQFLQLNTSIEINRRIGSFLDRHQLLHELANLIRDIYNYDRVQLFRRTEKDDILNLEYVSPAVDEIGQSFPISENGLLQDVLNSREPIFIADIEFSNRYKPDPKWPGIRSRAILPIRLGDNIIGLLDLHSHRQTLHMRHELIGLQLMADQLGIAIRNAELYAEALQAKDQAEQANKLKTRLLANVSHELRTPINVIMGYSHSALSIPNPYGIDLPPTFHKDLEYIYSSGVHLVRLINDLLDLSRAEIGELSIFPEIISTHTFLSDVFASFTNSLDLEVDSPVRWSLEIPDTLPVIQADPARLRQIILNLLSNAQKFTYEGQITLGAELVPPHLHIWVQDTGIGIPNVLKSRIFDSFVTGEYVNQKQKGIGLGLTISRKLVMLHGGRITFNSEEHQGSTFHVYLPLPTLSGQISLPEINAHAPIIVVFSRSNSPSEKLSTLATRNNLAIRMVHPSDDIKRICDDIQPTMIIWDDNDRTVENWGVIQQIYNSPQWRQTPFVLYDQSMEVLKQERMGIVSVLPKPAQERSLVDIFRFLSVQQGAPQILVVDDSREARELYTRLAQEAIPDAHIVQAENGVKALDLISNMVPNLVILDLMMPEMDGFDLLEAIRSKTETKQVPVIIMSGKQLTFEDVQRLDFAGVTFQTKNMLYDHEIIEILQRGFFGDETLPQPTSRLVKHALAYLHQNYAEPLSRAEIAAEIGFSENYLTDLFRREIGITPWDCLNRFRIQRAAQLLVETEHTISFVAQEVGYDDPAYFSRVFTKYMGLSPRDFRKNPG